MESEALEKGKGNEEYLHQYLLQNMLPLYLLKTFPNKGASFVAREP